MAIRRSSGIQRYLLDGERVVVAMHQHWARAAAPVAAAFGGLVLALWVDAHIPLSAALVSQVVWLAWWLQLGWTCWQLLEWRHDWFVATDKRLLLTYGLVTRRVAMMPLIKVTDMSYRRSIPGRLLGYGQFIMESAGQDQALHDINWVPDPDRTYRAICAEMFGVDDHDPSGDGFASFSPPPWPEHPGSETPSAVEEFGPNSRAIPLHQRSPEGRSIYQSEDLRERRRLAETGPIPIYPPASDD
ncbi:MAG: PH domain-containing protein [Mycobacteriales bacterium]